jgi:nucleotide-binding universal stress UspA family protein
MYKHILVAVDASEPSKRAVALAAGMARNADAKLTLLHVIRDIPVPEGLLEMADVEKIVGVRGDLLVLVGNKILKEAKGIAAKNGKREVETVLGDGDPATEIMATAKSVGADLIVIGTRGLSKLKGALLGSVSRKLSNLSPINTLIVK